MDKHAAFVIKALNHETLDFSMTMQALLLNHFALWTAADTIKKRDPSVDRDSTAKPCYGIEKLRELIVNLAITGRLLPQELDDEPATELLKRIHEAKHLARLERNRKVTEPCSAVTVSEHAQALPQGWAWVRLGDIIEVINGVAFSGKDFVAQGVGVVKIGDIQQGKICSTTMSKVSEQRVKDLADRVKVLKGDVVIALSGATTGKLGVHTTTEIFYLNQRVGKIVPYLVSPHFLYLALTAKLPELVKQSAGSAILNLTTKQLKALPIALPPLAEQQRIATEVEVLMCLCEQLEQQQCKAVQTHEKLVQQLLTAHLLGTTHPVLARPKHTVERINWSAIIEHFDTLFSTEASIATLQQLFLQRAVMGKLVPQDPYDEPTYAFLAINCAKKIKPIQDAEKPFEIPASWTWLRLSQLTELITSGSRGWARYLAPDGAQFISMANLSRGSYALRLTNMRYVNPPHTQESVRSKVQAKDVLISITGDVGHLGRIPEDFGAAYINQHIALVRFIPPCRNRYFPEVLRSSMAVLQLNEPQRGIKNSLRLSDVKNMLIPLPPRQEQARIVAKIDEVMALCEQLTAKITATKALEKQLADAFVTQMSA